MKISGLIVAAGLSSRMNDFKPLMMINNKPLILNTIDSLRQSGINDICVVVGYRGEEIEEALKNQNIEIVYNHDYNMSQMYDSFKIGLRELKRYDAIAFIPGDIGFVSKYTIDTLINEISKNKYKVVIPTYKDEIGHPPIINSECFDYLLNYDGNQGLKGGLKYFEKDSIQISTPDKFILFDADTKTDFDKVRNYYENRNNLTEDECMYLLEYCNVSQNIINHCDKVEKIGLDLSNEINKLSKYNIINTELIRISAKLHDIKRVEKNHDIIGANFLRDLGFDKISNIIKTHMDLPEIMAESLNENSILYLSDKLVVEDKFIDLENKFKYKMDKYKNNRHIFEKIIKKYNIALKIKSNVISMIGVDNYNRLEKKWREDSL